MTKWSSYFTLAYHMFITHFRFLWNEPKKQGEVSQTVGPKSDHQRQSYIKCWCWMLRRMLEVGIYIFFSMTNRTLEGKTGLVKCLIHS